MLSLKPACSWDTESSSVWLSCQGRDCMCRRQHREARWGPGCGELSMPGTLLRVQAWRLGQGGPNSSGLNSTKVRVSDGTGQWRAGVLPREGTEEPAPLWLHRLHMVLPLSPQQLTTALRSSPAGASVPFPSGAPPQRRTQPLPHTSLPRTCSRGPPRCRRGRRNGPWGTACSLPHQASSSGFPQE